MVATTEYLNNHSFSAMIGLLELAVVIDIKQRACEAVKAKTITVSTTHDIEDIDRVDLRVMCDGTLIGTHNQCIKQLKGVGFMGVFPEVTVDETIIAKLNLLLG